MYVYVLTVCLLSKPVSNRYGCFLFSMANALKLKIALSRKNKKRHLSFVFDSRFSQFFDILFILHYYSKCKLQYGLSWQHRNFLLFFLSIKKYIFYLPLTCKFSFIDF